MTLAVALATATLCLGVADAAAKPYRPPHGRIFHGVSDTGFVHDYNQFSKRVGKHTALLQDFYHWGTPLTTGALDRWRKTRTRGVLSLSTGPGNGSEIHTPEGIAHGKGDRYLLRLRESIAASKQMVYLRPLAEMNGHWNPYCAFNSDGGPRRHGHATKWFRRAWRRMVIIIRGGKRFKINHRLLKLGLPRILRAKKRGAGALYHRKHVPKYLDPPKVAFMWVPQTRGSPNVHGNRPVSYWPGGRYVDWVGADAYAKFSNRTLWHNLKRFYHRWSRWPFVVGEYGPWDNDVNGNFTRRIFSWAKRNKRVRALLYFRSVNADNNFNLQYYPGAKAALQTILKQKRFARYAPGTRHRSGGGGGGIHP